MDTELLRTFLEVKQTRHFARAADNLFVTQAAVSARIRLLETRVGQRLFTRSRNNIQLTAAGARLVPYAESILAAWSRALMETAHGERGGALFVLGCLPSLREIYLDDWLSHLLEAPGDWLLQIESLNTQELVQRIRERSVSVGVLYEPPRAADLWSESLTRFDLILVSTTPDTSIASGLSEYIYVDWGSSFAVAHNDLLTGLSPPVLKLDTPVLAHRLMLTRGGSAYLARPTIAEDLQAGRLHIVRDAPVIQRQVYLVGNREAVDDVRLGELVSALRARVDH